jgi:hypothetical protein
LLYGAGTENGSSSPGATGGSSAGPQGDETVGTLTNAELWRLYRSGAGAGSSTGSDNGSLANDLTVSAKYTGGSGGGLMFFVTGATGADAATSGSQQGTTGSTALTLANGQLTVTTTPLVYQPGSDDGPGVVTAVWTGCEGDVQFMPVADEEVQSASPPEYSGPTIQAAPLWYISAWYTFFGRLASDQPLISDPRGSKSFEAGGTTYFVPNYVHDDTFYWIAGNLYHRPLIGDVIGTAELPFRFLANPGRFANATVDGAVGTITNIPRLPEIWSDMPDYQRQDWVIRMLAVPYLTAAGVSFSDAGKYSKSPEATHFYGTAKPFSDGATPGSIYTHIDPDSGKAVQNAIDNADGKVIGHVDFKNHGVGAPSGHGHRFPQPGNPSSGHGPGKPHIRNNQLPPGWDALPPKVEPHTPLGR